MATDDILEYLNDLGLVSIDDIYAGIINNCDPLDGTDTYKDTEEESIIAYCTSLVHLLLSSTPLGINTYNNTLHTITNHELDEGCDFNEMDWVKHRGMSIRDHGIVSRDFYTDFMDSHRVLRTLNPPMWPRPHQQPWKMHEKAKLLPMIPIPCILDKKTPPVSLMAQDHLQLPPSNIHQMVALGHDFYTDDFFDVQDINPLPNLELKTTRYLPRMDQCNKTVPQQTADNDDDFDWFPDLTLPILFDADTLDSTTIGMNPLYPPLDTALQHTPMTLTPSPQKEDDTLQPTLTKSPPSTEHDLILPGQQKGEDTPIKEGTSAYWSKSNKQASVISSSSLISPRPSPIVSLSNSLFDNHRSVESNPAQHMTLVDETNDDYSHQGSGRRSILSMKSLSIDDDFDHDPTEYEFQKTQHQHSHHGSQQGVSSHHVIETTKVGHRHSHHPQKECKKPTFRSNAVPAPNPRSFGKGKEQLYSPTTQPFVFSPGLNVRDFLANRQTQPVSSSSLIDSAKLKRAWCDLDEPSIPVKKKEAWKLTGRKRR